MKVLVIGNGGREDAICKKISESKKCTELYCSKGNAGTLRYAKNIDLKSNEEIFEFSNTNNIDLVVVGPEAPLCDGIVDLFSNSNIKVFGADKKSARLEGSKDFAKEFMKKYEVPTAKYETIRTMDEGLKAIERFSYPIVVKADGLCAGKGVRICNTKNEVLNYFKELFEEKVFGDEGTTVVIEEFLKGKEASLLCFVSKGNLIPMESARDYKRIFDNDEGENTGGVGCYSPSELFTDELKLKVDKTLKKIFLKMKISNVRQILNVPILLHHHPISPTTPNMLKFLTSPSITPLPPKTSSNPQKPRLRLSNTSKLKLAIKTKLSLAPILTLSNMTSKLAASPLIIIPIFILISSVLIGILSFATLILALLCQNPSIQN